MAKRKRKSTGGVDPEYLKKQNHWIYRQMNKYFLGVTMKMKSWAGRKIIILGYAISQKIYGFN